ncbi:MAG: hypothetical protein OEM52_02330 [bacterium]|nr:hypothetical protein [bacterium]
MKLFALQDWLARVPYLSDWVRHHATDRPTETQRELKRQDVIRQRMKTIESASSEATERSSPDGRKFRKWKQPGSQNEQTDDSLPPEEENKQADDTPKKGQYIDRYI